MKNKININAKLEFIIVLLGALLLVFGTTILMGTMTSGFHLVDDHEFLKWTYEMERQNIPMMDILTKKVMADFGWRYEPLYYSARIFGCGLFGINLTVYFVMKALETVVSLVFLYYCGRLMGARKGYAALFSLISMVGYQSAVWWKLGPQESQCTALFSAGFFCMLKYLTARGGLSEAGVSEGKMGNTAGPLGFHKSRGKKGWMGASLLLFGAMVNYKESYIILVPFLMLYVLYYELQEEETITLQKIGQTIRARLGYLVCLGIIFLAPVAVIVTCVGTNNYGTVGLEAGVPLSVYADAISESLQGDLKWFKRFGMLFCAILLTYYDELKKLWKEMLLTIAFLLPQFIVFGRSGISERYILPSSIGFAFFFVLVITKWKPLSGRRRVVYVSGLLLLLAAHGRVCLREADYFRHRGEGVTAMLEAVNEMAGPDTKVLACFRPNEEGNLTINYWQKLHDFDQVYYWDQEKKVINRVCDSTLIYEEEFYKEESFEDMDIVVMYNRTDRHWVYDMSLDLTGFSEIPCGTLTIYVREGSVDQLVEPKVEGLKIHF